MRKILCISTANYYPFPTRKQNIMNRLSDCEIIYAEPPVTYIAPLKDPKARERIRAYKGEVVMPKEYISVYASPPVLPFFNKKRYINEINQKKLAKYYASLCRKHGFGKDFTVWCYSPTSADIIAPLAKELGIEPASLWKNVVYDCVDRHSAYPGMIDPEVVDTMEEDLARSAGCVFATARGLYERLKAFNPNTHLIENGANYELFSSVLGKTKTSDKPVFGFVGMLQQCIDYDCLELLAKSFPEAILRFAGRSLPGVDLSRLEKYPNVEFLGLRPQTELPDIIADFDVCLNVFADNELSRDVSPLKFYEYLATGKPVVSTEVPLQVNDFSDCIYIADSTEDFIVKCREALNESSDDPKKQLRLEAAVKCSWEARVQQMKNILKWNTAEVSDER